MKIAILFPVALIVAVLLVSGCSSGSGKVTVSAGPVKLATNYYRFDPSVYQKALDDKKIVLLFFKANWCPTCLESAEVIHKVFNEMEGNDVVGFEVHYNDDESKEFDTDMIKKYQIAYQDAMVVLDKNGKETFRALAYIIEDKVKSAIEKARNA